MQGEVAEALGSMMEALAIEGVLAGEVPGVVAVVELG
jgi:hypothetical protein